MTKKAQRQCAKTTSSCKSKGRRLQQDVAKAILLKFPQLRPCDVSSTPMGCAGADIRLSTAAKSAFPYSVECKNVERLNVWDAYDQACANSGDYEPLLVMKKNRKKPLVVMDAESFINLVKKCRIQ